MWIIRAVSHSCAAVPVLAWISFAVPTLSAQGVGDQPAPSSGVQGEKFTLPNGLTVVVHEDRKLPIIAVEVRYKVGSAHEPEGMHGYAHLFEHLLFTGSLHVDEPYQEALRRYGGSWMGGGTIFDNTQTYQIVPSSNVEGVLFLESDRMGYLAESLTQETFDREREVVKNELRERRGRVMARIGDARFAGLFPPGHPYHHTPIGSETDLNAATLEDARSWFGAYYGPANAILSLAGDVDVERARTLVTKYFGTLSGRARPAIPSRALPQRVHSTSVNLEVGGRVGILNRGWTIPPAASRETALFAVVKELLSVDDGPFITFLTGLDGPATSVRIGMEEFRPVGVFDVTLELKDGVDEFEAANSLDRALEVFVNSGITSEGVTTTAAKLMSEHSRAMQSVLYQAATTSAGELDAGDPKLVSRQLEWISSASPEDIRAVAMRLLAPGWHEVSVEAGPERTTSQTEIDRSEGPPPPSPILPDIVLPGLARFDVAGGTELVVVPRPSVGLVDMWLILPAGFSADPLEQRGIAKLTGRLLGRATRGQSPDALRATAASIGATIDVDVDVEMLVIKLEAPPEKLQAAAELLAEVALEARFDTDALARERESQRTAAAREQESALRRSFEAAAIHIYGETSAYGMSWSGNGTAASLATIEVEDIERFYSTWLRPEHAVILTAGDVEPEAVRSAVEGAFGDWVAGDTPLPGKVASARSSPETDAVILLNQPGATQAYFFLSRLVPPARAEAETSLQIALDILTTEGINARLRGSKGWTYGFGRRIEATSGQRMMRIQGAVQADRAGDAAVEIRRIMQDLRLEEEITSDVVRSLIESRIRGTLPNIQSNADLLDNMVYSLRMGLKADDMLDWKEYAVATTHTDVADRASDLFDPDDWLWIVVGEASVLAEQLSAAGFQLQEQ